MSFTSHGPEPCASANSAISANVIRRDPRSGRIPYYGPTKQGWASLLFSLGPRSGRIPYSNHIILLSEHPFVNLNVSVEQCLNHRADLIRKAVKFANGLIDLFHLLILG